MAMLLIAGNDEGIRHVHEALFVGRGVTVMTATDGAAALEAANLQYPDVVITDLAMPRVDGLQLCRALRMHPRLRKTPVIILSDTLRPGDPRTRTAQVCSVLPQPVDGDDLVAAVRFQLERGNHGHGVFDSAC
jgi:CheY-like chemotaxis protein